MGSAGAILRIAFRHLFARRVSLIVGGLLLAATAILLVIGTIRSNIARSTKETLITGFVGHLQVFSSNTKGEMAVYQTLGGEDVVPIDDFPQVRERLLSVENVAAVVPMGVGQFGFVGGNVVDRLLARLRATVDAQAAGPGEAQRAEQQSLENHVRRVVELLWEDLRQTEELVDPGAIAEDLTYVERASSQAFWEGFRSDPYAALEFLENKIAPLAHGEMEAKLEFVGVDIEDIHAHFPRLEIVDGEEVPVGRRGLMLSKYIYETQFKIATARRLDRLKKAMEQEGRTIADDPQLQNWVEDNQRGSREILLQLDPVRAQQVARALQAALGSSETGLAPLLETLLATDDANFAERHRIFYEVVAPHIDLYWVRVGEELTIKAQTKSGYMKSVNVRLWGTYKMRNMPVDLSPIREYAVLDLVTMRDLFGYLTADQVSELRALEASVGGLEDLSVEEVERRMAEGDSAPLLLAQREIRIDDELSLDPSARGAALEDRVYTPEERASGAVLNAAILLHDPSGVDEALEEIEAVAAREGLAITPVGWRKGSGFMGDVAMGALLVLDFFVAIIFLVVAIILNNTTMMVTLQRVREIGTLRAIGAQRPFALWLVLTEMTLAALIFGGLGCLAGALYLHHLGVVGIGELASDFSFFYGGPRLYPVLGIADVVISLGVVLGVVVIASGYPAMVATRVQPVVAMQTED